VLVDAFESYSQSIPGLLRRSANRAPAPVAQRQAAAHPVRHPGRNPPADVRSVHDRLLGSAVPSFHPASPTRNLGLRGQPHQRQYARSGEEKALARYLFQKALSGLLPYAPTTLRVVGSANWCATRRTSQTWPMPPGPFFFLVRRDLFGY
jgi:hypothetical protein